MGCGGSTEAEVQEEGHVEVTDVEAGDDALTTNKVSLEIAETDAVKAKPGSETFIASVLKAREEAAEDAEVIKDCCTRLQAHNRRLKEYVATYDANTVNEAMNGGFMGMGCNDSKLIAALCTRTKAQLQRTKKKYRDLYDKDMRAEVQGETGGAYRKLMYFVLAAPDAYIADIIDMACNEAAILEFGCDEICLLEVFVTRTQEELQAGKAKWEGRTDKSLVDFINSNLGHSYRHLNRLLQLLFMGDRVETDETDEELAATQVGELKEECDKGWFEDFDESKIIEIIGANTTAQNQLVAQLYEKEHGVSLARDLKGKCGVRLFYALNALLLTKTDFLAMRLHDAMEGWFNNQSLLTRLLGGLDGDRMVGVAEAFERKYDQPLWSALKENLGDGDFLRAALTWINALGEPSRGAEKFTEQDVDALDGDCAQLVPMLDWLLLEHDSLLVFVAHLDIETIREACKGWGTDDTALIRAFATRNKRSLARVNVGYRQKHGEPLQQLIDSELGGSSKNEWYLYLAKFLVVQEEQADAMILDLAMQGGHVDHEALVEFLCGRHPKRVRAAKARWEASHDDSLVDLLADHLSGDMARLALKMLKGKRDTDDPVDEHLARRQAHQLHDGELDYVDTLTSNSAAQNKAVARYFEEAYDTSLKRAIGQEYSGPVKAALLALMLGPADWYASQLKAALGGETTNDRAVCRIVGAHDKDEIKEIARAYDRKYGCTLKSAISSECRGNYKRLAVAWVDLPDQLAQPEKLIERASMADVPEEPTNEGHGEAFDDEISDEDDSVTERPDPASALFAAKMANWTAKYHKYIDMGKRSKADHYQRLILWYPPMPLGHKVLKGYLEALAEEYKGGQQSDDDWTTIWFETVSDEDFDADGDGESDGTDRAAFKAWMDVTESMIAEKRTTINELKSRWGLNEKKEEEETPKYEEPVIASYTTTTTTVASYATNYPQAIPVARPAMPIAQPVQQQYVRPAAYPGAPPIYGTGVAPPIYGQQPMMMMQQQPMMYGQQPMMYGGGMYQPQMQRPMMQYGGGVSVSVNISM